MRGISTVIATILLLVMIVVITAGVFYFFRGTLTTATTKGQESLTGAITETEVQAKVKIVSYYNNSGNLSLTISNSLDDKINVTRVDVDGESYTIGQEINAGSVGDINTGYNYSLVKPGETKVIVYFTYNNKNYYIEQILS